MSTDDHDGITQDDLQELFRAIRNGSDLTENAEAKLLDALIDDDTRRREEHKTVLDAVIELRREVALLRNRIDGGSNEEWIPTAEVDYWGERIYKKKA